MDLLRQGQWDRIEYALCRSDLPGVPAVEQQGPVRRDGDRPGDREEDLGEAWRTGVG